MSSEESIAIRALQRGDIAGLGPLFAVYQLQAVRTAYLIVGERQIAEDVVADAFLTVYDRSGSSMTGVLSRPGSIASSSTAR